MKKYIVTSLVAAVAATSAIAGPSKVVKEVIVPEDPCLFRDQEIQLDLFGLGDFYKGRYDMSGRPAYGGGVGVNYFFMKYVGIGFEQEVYGRNTKGNRSQLNDGGYTRWKSVGNLFLRYPICQWNLAPYVMIGGGADYGRVGGGYVNSPGSRPNKLAGKGFGHVGGGLEYRVTQNIGLFTDARYAYSRVGGLPANELLWRYGVRFAF
jgi:hypothetical protein